ncbi:MAG TPA: phosphodiester glycosidase family protein [Anaeromyxobacteraceae bacterium]|nr:phosphodiester glycosidase family protein [Anaeromyxobacteraceae bacterium]
MDGGIFAPALLALCFAAPPAPVAPPPPAPPRPPVASGFTALEPGLDLGLFPGPASAPGDGQVWVARIDPARFELRLLNASAGDARPHTVREWALAAGAVAGINAGMFQTDGLTSLGLMRSRAHQNNPRLSGRLKAVLAFDPLRPGLPRVQILDGACGELDPFPTAYGTLIQSIRMVSCDRKNVWAPEARRFSAAAIGLDGAGRALFIHARSPYKVHDLIDALLALPLDLRRALYVEGGPEAQLYVHSGEREVERLGAIEGQTEERGLAWEVPNVVVAVRRP